MMYDRSTAEVISSLREVSGSGYEKMDVIKQAQEMMKEMKALEKALELKGWEKEYETPEHFRKFRLRAARTTGFAAEDVKRFLSGLEDKIVHMRSKLEVERDKKNWNQEWQTDSSSHK
ncbi:MAG: hypothetical protein IJ806_10465 [Ruminococcus sp.]|nr:hypothetical protein [Ruminococcus sp.]